MPTERQHLGLDCCDIVEVKYLANLTPSGQKKMKKKESLRLVERDFAPFRTDLRPIKDFDKPIVHVRW
ncbi:hypothetical protein T4D_16715 [Trichinella pseudospiralis]|uniref:Uncharacterized protein n=1 Tax=Trichinella pseudospiralis TaxID=6337 RepID=A0A0V1FRB1_TRIPS|nr:hypothetical protein T4D_16715 [Trichinella pseudospiralis]